jgi:hypothetical protein
MSYSADLTAVNRRVGSFYVARILSGAKPGDLSIQQPTKFDLAINLKIAKARIPKGTKLATGVVTIPRCACRRPFRFGQFSGNALHVPRV